MRTLAPLLACLLLACSTDNAPPSIASTDDGSSSTTSTELDTSSTAPASSSGDGMRLDVALDIDDGCQKIDFLFVIDNSGSMRDEQLRLVDGFPGFIASIEDTLKRFDHHIMVVTTEGRESDSCDDIIGAGRLRSFDGEACGPLGVNRNQRYLDETQEELADAFSCIADVGTQGSGNERPIWAMAQAVNAESRLGGCNTGFIRDDAILVVTIITDEEESGSPGNPALWHEVMVGAKRGDEEAVVMLALIGDTGLPDAVCEPRDVFGSDGADASPRLREFAESFTYGSWASVCAADYAPAFEAALGHVEESCVNFVPSG